MDRLRTHLHGCTPLHICDRRLPNCHTRVASYGLGLKPIDVFWSPKKKPPGDGSKVY
jgi:hypothetical protein